jgi:molybdopterin converting factor small subunit
MPAATTDRMVIYNAYLTIVADNISTALKQITDLATNYGGFVVNSNIGEDQNRLYAYISFRVLATHFDDTIQALHSLAVDVKAESTTGQDVTEDYTDLVSKLRNLEASETQLLELMKKAGSVEEILAVQKELVSTREDIEVIKGRMQYLEQSSNLALFTVNLEQSKLVVDFNADTRTIKAGGSVLFFPNISGGFSPYSYEWDFGDGATSTEANPAHAYNSDGTFTVTLKITDDKGSTAKYVREDYITVLAGWNAGNIVDSAWNALVGFGHFLSALFIGLGIFSPVWIVILVILYFAWWRRRKRKAKSK